MIDPIYQRGTVETLIDGGFVNEATSKLLRHRINLPERTASLLSEKEFALLTAACETLLPQQGKHKVPLAGMVEESLATGLGKGWRYNQLPPQVELFQKGLKAIDEEARQRFEKGFAELATEQREELLQSVQTGDVQSQAWTALPAPMFFTELLALATEQYYCHPFVKEQIGDLSFADEKGWNDLSLNNQPERPVKKEQAA